MLSVSLLNSFSSSSVLLFLLFFEMFFCIALEFWNSADQAGLRLPSVGIVYHPLPGQVLPLLENLAILSFQFDLRG